VSCIPLGEGFLKVETKNRLNSDPFISGLNQRSYTTESSQAQPRTPRVLTLSQLKPSFDMIRLKKKKAPHSKNTGLNGKRSRFAFSVFIDALSRSA